MARKTKLVTITREGRDKGKVFEITEKPASQAERWAARAFLGAAKSGIEVPENVKSLGIIGIAQYGLVLIAQLPVDEAFYLMDEMMTCVRCRPDASNDFARALVEDDIEEISTRITLRKEVFGLHVDFIDGALSSILDQAPTQDHLRN